MCKFPACAVGAASGVCNPAGGQAKTCECEGADVQCTAATNFQCYPSTVINSQKQCGAPTAPPTCGINAITQCSCLTGCKSGKCAPCTRTAGAQQDVGCPPVDTPVCLEDRTDFMNNRCVVSRRGRWCCQAGGAGGAGGIHSLGECSSQVRRPSA